MTCPKPAGCGWQGKGASDQFSLTLERTVGSWSELGAVGTRVLLGSAERKGTNSGGGTWAGPRLSRPGTFLSVCRRLPLGSRGIAGKLRVQPTTSPTSTGCYFLLSSYLSPQCLGGTEPRASKPSPPRRMPAGYPPSVWGEGGGPKPVC